MKKQILLYLMALLIFSTLCVTTTADVLPPTLEIERVAFSRFLYAGQTRTLSIYIKNTGLGNAHGVTVELSSNLQGLSFPASTKVPKIRKGGTERVNILISGKKELSNNEEARISIRLIDKEHNQKFPFDKPRIREFITLELELVLDQVKFKNVSRQNKSIQRNDVINLKFRVWNKSGVTAETVEVKVNNNQKGVIWKGVEIGNELVMVNRGESPPKEHPTFEAISSQGHKIINYIYHLDSDFNDHKVRFTISGTVGSEKDYWAKEEYKHPVIVPFNWLPIVGWVGGVAIVAILSVVAIKKSGFWYRRRVLSVVYSPDGEVLASGSGDRTVKLWAVNALWLEDMGLVQRNIATFEGHTKKVNSIAYSPDGKILASGSDDTAIKLWDVNTQRNIATFEGHTAWVHSVAYSPDGKTLASGSDDKTVKLWDVNTQRNIATFEGHTRKVNSIAYSPDGKILASGSDDKTFKLWDVNTQRNIATY